MLERFKEGAYKQLGWFWDPRGHEKYVAAPERLRLRRKMQAVMTGESEAKDLREHVLGLMDGALLLTGDINLILDEILDMIVNSKQNPLKGTDKLRLAKSALAEDSRMLARITQMIKDKQAQSLKSGSLVRALAARIQQRRSASTTSNPSIHTDETDDDWLPESMINQPKTEEIR